MESGVILSGAGTTIDSMLPLAAPRPEVDASDRFLPGITSNARAGSRRTLRDAGAANHFSAIVIPAVWWLYREKVMNPDHIVKLRERVAPKTSCR